MSQSLPVVWRRSCASSEMVLDLEKDFTHEFDEPILMSRRVSRYPNVSRPAHGLETILHQLRDGLRLGEGVYP